MAIGSRDRGADRGRRLRTLLLRCVIILGVVVTPLWLGALAWFFYRLASWLMN